MYWHTHFTHLYIILCILSNFTLLICYSSAKKHRIGRQLANKTMCIQVTLFLRLLLSNNAFICRFVCLACVVCKSCFPLSPIQIACTAVAALIQYFFLCAFCWMMCEGVMLYLMLVAVFSTLSKKWWFFLLLGWGMANITCLQFAPFSCILCWLKYSLG